jgi:hypothetical protein
LKRARISRAFCFWLRSMIRAKSFILEYFAYKPFKLKDLSHISP